LEGKVAIVTGAGAGFGRGIVKKFVAEGAKVLCVDIDEKGAKETADAAPEGHAVAFRGDVTSESDWKNALQTVLKEFGKLDVVCNNAGVVNEFTPSHKVSEAEYDRLFRINVKPLYLSCKVIVDYWKENKQEGLFINTSSISEPRPRPMGVWYAATKGAVTVTTRGLAIEYAPDKIRFNCIRPAVGETAMLPVILGAGDTPEGRSKIVATIPLGRACKPEDVANAACYLASDEASYMTGACMDVDGGRGI